MEKSNLKNNQIAYFKSILKEKNNFQDKFYFKTLNDIEYYKLGNTEKTFLLSTILSSSGLNIYINRPLTFPPFNEPPFNWLEYVLSVSSSTLNNLLNNLLIEMLYLYYFVIFYSI